MANFSNILIDWYSENKRDLPWRNTSNPYKIWLSEIILQQTRVAQGMNYYLKFVENFNTIKDLSEASEDEVLALWKGLGYYSRGRNLRKAAIQVMNEFDGVFPKDFENLKKLKGVGDYSAAAIASFSYQEKVAVVDGNVYRVLSRLYNIDTPIDTSAGKKQFSKLANSLISEKHPDLFNQAIMEFGALHCKPKKPNCEDCVFTINCAAYSEGTVEVRPVKSKKIKKKTRYLSFMFFEQDNSIALEKRGEKDIWANMFQFPLLEDQGAFEERNKELLWETKHLLTHQKLFCRFYRTNILKKGTRLVNLNDLEKYAIPRVIENFLERYYK
jgi:A/G-specific adenine glycosylase|tara:strand:+ start:388 stop:1371 length:984 start_codon:yes stop_codon:yes gene_type:complete